MENVPSAAIWPTEPAALPPGYPGEYQRLATLRDGRRVAVRPVLPSDAPELARAIRTADAETVRLRFLGGRPHVTSELMKRLTTVDYINRFALVAIDPGSQHGVGIARYEVVGDGAAEVAVAVMPAWRHVGLAGLLLSVLAQAAAKRGIHTFTGIYLAGNRPVSALIEDAGEDAEQLTDQGVTEFSVGLPGRGGGTQGTK